MRSTSSTDRIQVRLLSLAALYLGLFSLALTLSPAARARAWQVDYRWGHWLGFFVWLGLFGLAHYLTARSLPGRDPYLLPVVALLSGWGLLTIWRLFPSFGLRQTIWLATSVGIFTLGLRLPGHLAFLRKFKYLWLIGGLALTGLTLLLGTNPVTDSGPRLWLGCCGIYFQPSEPLKLLLIIYLAAYLADRLPFLSLATEQPARLPSPLLPFIAPTLVMTGLALLLLLAQRDLGTVTIFIFLYTTIVYLATRRFRVLLFSLMTLTLAGLGGYALYDVVRLRVDAWLNPWLDPSGRSFQIVQSLLAVANGGLLGRGPGMGNPNLVPIPHSDFIFTAITEESGLAGGLGLLLLLALLVARGLSAAIHAPDNFRRYLAAGLTAYLVAQSVLIIGGNLRLLPLTGVTLPFVSYGGSSLLTAFLSLLILLQISNRSDDQPQPQVDDPGYQRMGGFLLAGLAAAALAAGWWAYYRGPDLLERTDNFRRAIADRYVWRGGILDRHDQPLSATFGQPGDLARQAIYPQLGSILGYTHPIYGQSGLEASLDSYLRGLRGNPAFSIWWNHLLYGQPPPGLDVRTSLDIDFQRLADQLLGEHPAALVLLNAESGEVLAMASHPTFDPNRLDETWEDLVIDPRAPLLNRATLGRYPPGAALGPLLMAAVSARGTLPLLPGSLDSVLGGQALKCAVTPLTNSWASALAAGCPGAQAALGRALGADDMLQLFTDLGFYASIEFTLPTNDHLAPEVFSDLELTILGQSEISTSPLQMALAIAALSNNGTRPAPRLALAVENPTGGWSSLPLLGGTHQIWSEDVSQTTANSLATGRQLFWQSIASTPNGPEYVTWYLAGTLPTWDGAPLALVVLLEEDNPGLATAIGQRLMQAATQP